jgi:hypothetical protein
MEQTDTIRKSGAARPMQYAVQHAASNTNGWFTEALFAQRMDADRYLTGVLADPVMSGNGALQWRIVKLQ